jgi:hypothetical protein
MSLLSKYTLDIKSILTEKIIDVIADIILQYTGSFVHGFDISEKEFNDYEWISHGDNSSLETPIITCILTANVISTCIIKYATECRIFFAINEHIGKNEKRNNFIPYDEINRLNPLKEFIFNKNMFLNFDYDLKHQLKTILTSPTNYLYAFKFYGGINIYSTKNDYIFSLSVKNNQEYTKDLNKREYDQFVSDFVSIIEFIAKIVTI